MSSKLRPECGTSRFPAIITRVEAFIAIRNAVMRRRSLIHGRLEDGEGHYCAIGAFWEDNPGVILPGGIVDEVAAINDAAVPSMSDKARWTLVKSWLVNRVGW